MKGKFMDESTKVAIDELTNYVAATTSALAVQLIEVQALTNVILDIERERIIAEGRPRPDVLQYLEKSFQTHRIAAYKIVQSRLRLGHIEVDLDATDYREQ